MALTVTARGSIWNTTAGNKSPTAFTPAVGDVLVVFCANSGRTTAQAPTVSDNNSDGLGSYTKVGSDATKNASADSGWWFIRNSPIGSASSTTVTMTQSSDTGGGCQVWSVGPLNVGGSARVGAKGKQDNAAAGTPSLTLDATPVTTSAILGAVFTGSNVTTNTAPPTNFTEHTDLGYNTPASGLEAVSRASGHTSTTVAWTAATATGFLSSAIEVKATQVLTPPLLDASPTLYAPTVTPTNAVTVPLLDASPALYAPTVFLDKFVTLPLLSSGSYREAALKDNPVAYWRFGEPSGSTANDEVGPSDGTYIDFGSGPPTLGVSGLLVDDADTAASFSSGGAAQFVDISSASAVLDVFDGTTPWTVVIWFRGTVDGTLRWMFSTSDAGFNNGVHIGVDNVNLHVQRINAGGGDDNATTPLASDTTYQVIATYDGSNIRTYVNGSAVGSPTASTRSIPTQTLAMIGVYTNWGGQTNGKLDEPEVFDYAFSAAQAADLYNAGLGQFAPDLFGPTLTQSGAVITLPLLDSGPALYAPTVTPKNTLTLGLLDGGAALFAPTATPTNTVTLGLLDAGNALYAPSVLAVQSIVLGLLDASNALYAPVVIPDQFVTVPLLDGGPTLYAPTVTTVNAITLGFLDAGPALYAPEVIIDQFVTIPLLDAGSATYAPSVSVSVTVPLLDAGNALYAPVVIPDQFVTLPLLDAGNALYEPTLAAPGGIALPLLDAGNALYAPDVIPDQFVTVGFLDAGSATYAPTLVVGSVTITIGLLDAGPAVYAPDLTSGTTVALPLLDSGPALYAPAIAETFAVVLPIIDSGRDLYAPAFSYDQLLALPIIDAAATLYEPTLAFAVPALPDDVSATVSLDGVVSATVTTLDVGEVSVIVKPEMTAEVEV